MVGGEHCIILTSFSASLFYFKDPWTTLSPLHWFRITSLSPGPQLKHNCEVPFAMEGNSHRLWGLGQGHLWGAIMWRTTKFCPQGRVPDVGQLVQRVNAYALWGCCSISFQRDYKHGIFKMSPQIFLLSQTHCNHTCEKTLMHSCQRGSRCLRVN